jgi:predicted HTH domain antitoxin
MGSKGLGPWWGLGQSPVNIGDDFMNTTPVTFNVPETISRYVNLEDKEYQFKIQEFMLYELVSANKISFGKAAELLGISKIDLITDLGKAGFPYFEQSFDETLEDALTARK